jgi:TonB-linked SusC/RagA family outer membrane protein
MRSKFIRFLTLLIVFAVQFSFAQEKKVTGTVSDELGPVPGASVVIKGTTTGTTTDFDGKYEISAKKGDVLEISYVGIKQTVTVGDGAVYNILIKTDTLEGVTLISEGYDRTRTRATTSTAQTTVTAETIQNRPNSSVLASLQGTAPGLTIISSSGSPGSAKFDGFIRGSSSITGSTDPLIVIDGIPSNSNQFRNLNQNDIESVSVLRDASGTAIYGNKGANGVIQITTKRAKYNSGVQFSYDFVTGFNTLPENKYNMANARELLTIEKSFGGPGLGPTLSDEEIANYDINTNWTDQFFQTDITKQHNLGITFGGENFSSFTSLGYFEQGGMVPTTDFKRFSVRNNSQGKSKNEKFTFDTQINLAHSKRNQLDQEVNGGVNNNTIQNPLHGAVMGLPYAAPSPYNTGRELLDAIGFNFSGANDTYVLQDILRENSLPSWFTENSAILNIGAGYKLTDNLTIRNRSGFDYKEADRVFARAPWSYLALAVQTSRGEAFGGSETMQNTKEFTFTNIASLNYTKTFNESHNLTLGAYMEYTKIHYLFKTQFQNGLNPLNYSPGAGTGYVPFNGATPNSFISTVGADKLDGGTLSYFGTADYEYKDKYGLSALVRRDASYRFIDDNKWGTFWSVSGRWNIEKESFMEGSVFDMLKLRGSYGTNGNQNIVAANYGFPLLLTANDRVRDLNQTVTGYENASSSGVAQIANTTLQWEEVAQLNFGLDFIVFNNKLEGNIDWYDKRTTQLFNPFTTSGAIGQYGIDANNGELSNKGIELSLRYNIINKDDFRVSVFANGSHNTTRVENVIDNDQSGDSNLINSGFLLREWNLIPYAGVNQANGNLLFYDIDGNLTESPDDTRDRRATGKSFLPRYQGGFGFNIDYKGFFVNTLFSWTYDAWRIDNQFVWANSLSFIGDDNMTADLLNAWTPTNTQTNQPSLDSTNADNFNTSSDRFLYDSSFLRLKNVNLGYNFPSSFLSKAPISSLRLYVQGENLLTWTKWRGFDPEAITSLSVTNFPNPRTISFGVSVGF